MRGFSELGRIKMWYYYYDFSIRSFDFTWVFEKQYPISRVLTQLSWKSLGRVNYTQLSCLLSSIAELIQSSIVEWRGSFHWKERFATISISLYSNLFQCEESLTLEEEKTPIELLFGPIDKVALIIWIIQQLLFRNYHCSSSKQIVQTRSSSIEYQNVYNTLLLQFVSSQKTYNYWYVCSAAIYIALYILYILSSRNLTELTTVIFSMTICVIITALSSDVTLYIV